MVDKPFLYLEELHALSPLRIKEDKENQKLQNKSCNDIQDMLHEQKDINWNNYPTRWKRGVACYRVKDLDEHGNDWGAWVIDYEMPILKGEDRAYVDNLIFIGE